MNPADLNPTIAGIGLLILAAIWLLAQYGDRRPRVQPTRDLSWIDQRIAAERDPARRQAWRTIRRMTLEEENQ